MIEVTENTIIVKKKPFFEKLPRTFKKLVSVLVTSVLVIDNSDEKVVLKKILYIYYPV